MGTQESAIFRVLRFIKEMKKIHVGNGESKQPVERC